MNFKHTPNRAVTVEDKEYRISRSIAISVALFFFNQEDQTRYVPLAKRGKKMPDEPGKLCLPCGYLDRDETAAEAMRREVWEELWLSLNDLMRRYPRNWNMQQPFYVNSDPRDKRQNVTLEYFLSFEVDKLPELSPVNAEPGEIEDSIRMPVERACRMDMAFAQEMIVRERREWTQRHRKQ